ncbi:radical SAM family heme chaperone HemW [Schaalia sp. lx-100]|uniref:radical SAM family heme chaperone HemW n=1 Tax=Schaalia sp. lx-100 TaxID=2899081 RepID=UPI001E544C4D|nr:radical SAM family heme chaperone HemW [Schaalia sp. lx-100]
MSLHQPDGFVWPADGHIPHHLAEVHAQRPLSMYVHVPFCQVRCGYCDFNTYTTGFGQGADIATYSSSVVAETHYAAQVLQEAGFPIRPIRTLFYGGGTPTLLSCESIEHILTGIRDSFTLAIDAEITVEANPETVDEQSIRALAETGITRISFGMQSAVPHVLKTLDRTHRPERVPQVVAWARDFGLDVSLDLIYGTPGESLKDWELSLQAVLEMQPDHISAYALVIEEGTKMGADLARGRILPPDPDNEATKYEMADEILTEAGYRWYEISNFARIKPGEENTAATDATLLRYACRHNLAYWKDWDWWGLGPGSHSHIGRCRWWNRKHPRAYAQMVTQGVSPAAAGEILDAHTRELERVMLAVRTAHGLPIPPSVSEQRVKELIDEGLIDEDTAHNGRILLTLRGRLLADYVTHMLV